jgi:hypothetical protein
MASVEECVTALEKVLGDIAAHPAAAGMDRSVSCTLTDLGTLLVGRLRDGAINDLHAVPADPPPAKADIRLAMTSDDLVALTDGRLSFIPAWTSGRIKFHAGVRDMLRFRKFF